MRLLLDENLPKRLMLDFPGHEVFTVQYLGWNGLQNGALLQRMLEGDFDALITSDKSIEHQQNFKKYTLTVFVLIAPNNSYEELTQLTPIVQSHLDRGVLPTGPIVIRRGSEA